MDSKKQINEKFTVITNSLYHKRTTKTQYISLANNRN